MGYFVHVEGLAELERQEKWDEARELLYKTWAKDKLNNETFIRLFSECWYLLAEWDCWVKAGELSFKTFQNMLIECTEFGTYNFKDNPRFLCLAGYMISLFPYLFYVDDTGNLYSEWEQKGIDMLCKASELDPNDKIAEIFNLGRTGGASEYNNAKESISSELTTLFPGETLLEEYFREILSVKH
jgi:hypothetical protein